MIRWACIPTLALLVAGCAAAPSRTPVVQAENHPEVISNTAAAPAGNQPPASVIQPPMPAAHAPPRRSRPSATEARHPPLQSGRPDATGQASSAAQPSLAKPNPPAATIPGMTACPELALSYCSGRYLPPSSTAVAQLPLDRIRLRRRCEMEIYLNTPAVADTNNGGGAGSMGALRDHCTPDFAAVRARIDAISRLN